MHQCFKFILFQIDTLHVSDGLSVHHQTFKTVRTATSIFQILLYACQPADSSICGSMYGLELLMMDGKTVRNIQSGTPYKINLKHWCIQLVLLQKYITMYGPMNVIQYIYIYIYIYIYCIFFTLDAGLLARNQYSEGPATGHLDTGFSWFPCAYKQILRWFPRFQVATTCFSCSPPDLNLLVTNFMFCLHEK